MESIIVLDLDLVKNSIWTSRFDFLPFHCSGYASVRLDDFSDPLDAVVEIMRQIMTWRVNKPNSYVLMPAGLLFLEWSALFCYFVKNVDDVKIVSMCGDVEDFHLEPADDRIKLFNIDMDNLGTRMMRHREEITKVECFELPSKENWDWRQAATVAYLFFVDDYDDRVSLTQANTITF